MITGKWACYNCDNPHAEFRDDFGHWLCDICYSAWVWEHEHEAVGED